ncbi:hypothetical protein ACFY8C_38440 [Streptomyces flavochromogenes]|uniref:Uncharacterized protein n=1 Tax=Streptomyces flavochromogenes TaxID=68199 RepID=A0ABW6Y307_9ACTN
MSAGGVARHGERARAFVPDLIPALKDLDRTGPLDAREQRDLARIHEARDHYGNARWMRGMALEAAFRRQLFRGEDGTWTRQEYLDAEWDGMSEPAAYREIKEWRLARQIAETYGRPVANSHVRALLDISETRGVELVTAAYVALRQHGADTKQRVTAEVVDNLSEFLAAGRALPAAPERNDTPDDATGEAPAELDGLFAPRDIPGPREAPKPRKAKKSTAGVVEPSEVILKFENDGGWRLSESQTQRLSAWVAGEAKRCGMEPDEVADLLVDAITSEAAPLRPWADRAPQT